MKKTYFLVLVCCVLLVACGGRRTVKPTKPIPPVASKPVPTAPAPSASTPAPTSAPEPIGDAAIGDNSKKPGGYYLDDGPDANPPKDIDSISDATPIKEPLLKRSNRPYKALGQTYTPIATSQNYKERGIASWYGKRFHGKKTSSGEIYDMYSMSAAHTILPLPSYVKVTNVANGRSVLVRVNDRGPFKSTRIIDLSYAAAYKLRLVAQGSGMVEVEAIHAEQTTSSLKPGAANTSASAAPAAEVKSGEIKQISADTQTAIANSSNPAASGFFVQAGAFKNEANADALLKKIQGLEIEQNAGINRVYNGGLHRLKLGPYDSKPLAERVAASIRKQLNIATIITNQ